MGLRVLWKVNWYYAIFLDESGHIDPFFSRKHERNNQNPIFGLAAGYVMPVKEIRNFGTWVFKHKYSMFQSDFDRLRVHPDSKQISAK